MAFFANFASLRGFHAAFIFALQAGFDRGFAAAFLFRGFVGGEADGAEKEQGANNSSDCLHFLFFVASQCFAGAVFVLAPHLPKATRLGERRAISGETKPFSKKRKI